MTAHAASPTLPSAPLRVLCHFPAGHADAALWVRDLRGALPEATVALWQPGAAAADYAVLWRPTQQFFDEQPALRAVFNAGAGVDALTGLRLPPGATVVRLEDAGMAGQMADYVAHAVLHHVGNFDRYAEQQAAHRWQPRPPGDKAAHPVGVLGAGVMGSAVAQRLRVLGFTVHAWARTPRPAANAGTAAVYAGPDGLAPFLRATRILVCLLPLTPHTQGILCTATFARLQRGAYLVNAARGGHLVQADLLQALSSGMLAGATLDVAAQEPLAPDDALWSHPAVRITPHVAAATLRGPSVAQIAAKLRGLLQGQAISGVVLPERGY